MHTTAGALSTPSQGREAFHTESLSSALGSRWNNPGAGSPISVSLPNTPAESRYHHALLKRRCRLPPDSAGGVTH